MSNYYEFEIAFVFRAPQGSLTDEFVHDTLNIMRHTRVPAAVLRRFLLSPQEVMDVTNDYDELSYIRMTKIPFPPPPPLLAERHDECSVAIIFPEEDIRSQDSPRSSEDGTVGSLVDFIVDDGSAE